AGGGRGHTAAFRVAGLVRAAVVAACGRRAAGLGVQVGIAGAAGDRHHQVAAAGRHGDEVVVVAARRTRHAGDAHVVLQLGGGAATAAASTAHAHAGEGRDH